MREQNRTDRHSKVEEAFAWEKELLSVEEVASYLGVRPVTVWRWCRDGSLPCIKIARRWRIRRIALESFLERKERSKTLAGQLRAFLEVPDNVLAITQNRELMIRLDAAFFNVGAAHGGLLIKSEDKDMEESLNEMRAALERNGLEASRLEEEGRFRFIFEGGQPSQRREALSQLLAEEKKTNDRSIWVCFNWPERVDLQMALEQQQQLTRLVEDTSVVVKTSVLERDLDTWPGPDLRQAQVMHLGAIWFSDAGLALSRVVPPS
jgi:excisionase family DNA binding protein